MKVERHYLSNYLDSHDIDCFFKFGTVAFHFASNGQQIPRFITRDRNIKIQNMVWEQHPYEQGEFELFPETIMNLIQNEIVEVLQEIRTDNESVIQNIISNYAESFIEMARLGFVSMDLGLDGKFNIICKPCGQRPPDEIMAMLPEADYNFLEDKLCIINGEHNFR